LKDDISPQLLKCEVYNDLPENYYFNYCIISTKSWLNDVLADYLSNHLLENASILIFQNGLEIENSFIKINKNWKISRALTSLAAYRVTKTQAVEVTSGRTIIGGINYNNKQEESYWQEILTRIGLETEISLNIQRDIWLKTIVNCALCPLGAITGLKNGELLKDSFLKNLMCDIINEIIPLLPDTVDINFNDAYSLLEKIIETTSENKCSMLQDIDKGIKTEIDMLNGKIIERANKLEKSVPINSKLVHLVKKLSDEKFPQELAILELRSVH
jgi:2-dehydropantoate 2-reductase